MALIFIKNSNYYIFPCASLLMRQQAIVNLPISINPADYAKKHSKQLGNHFIYAKLTNNEKWNDPRLNVLKPDYFIGKSVLDIGCNQGILAIPIAIKFQPKIVKAIDVDTQMTNKAKCNIEYFVNKNQHYKYPKEIIDEIESLPKYFKQKIGKMFGQRVFELSSDNQVRPKDTIFNNSFPKNIEILSQNILSYQENDRFDCILCMNMTKWLHLAFGDEGIKQLFHQVERMSSEGTIFILESHPWSSYRKKKNMLPSYQYNYRMILLKPERFKDYVQKLGFEVVQTISPTSANDLKHQIIVFQKKNSSKSRQYF